MNCWMCPGTFDSGALFPTCLWSRCPDHHRNIHTSPRFVVYTNQALGYKYLRNSHYVLTELSQRQRMEIWTGKRNEIWEKCVLSTEQFYFCFPWDHGHNLESRKIEFRFSRHWSRGAYAALQTTILSYEESQWNRDRLSIFYCFIKKTRLFKYIENFITKKGKFSDKKI